MIMDRDAKEIVHLALRPVRRLPDTGHSIHLGLIIGDRHFQPQPLGGRFSGRHSRLSVEAAQGAAQPKHEFLTGVRF